MDQDSGKSFLFTCVSTVTCPARAPPPPAPPDGVTSAQYPQRHASGAGLGNTAFKSRISFMVIMK